MPFCGGTSTRTVINKAGEIYWSWSPASEPSVSTLLLSQCRVNLFDTGEEDTTSRRTAYNIQIQQRVSRVGNLTELLLSWRKKGPRVDARKEL